MCRSRRTAQQNEHLKKKCTKFLEFFRRHWDAAAARFDKDEVTVGSCTEAIVQHMLSCRMRTEPRSWSRRCAGIIASLRVAKRNGVDLRHPAPEQLQENGCTKYIHAIQEKLAGQPLSWDIFDPVREAFDFDSSTQHLIGLISAGGLLRAM